MICYLLSVELISVSLAVLILYTYPLLVLGFSVLSRQLALSTRLVSLFGLSFLGLYLALSGSEMNLSAGGILFAAIASLGSAYTFIKGAKVASVLNPLMLTFWVNLLGLVMIIPFVIGQYHLPLTIQALIPLSLATLFYIIGVLCQFQALSRLRAATAAFILNLEPMVSILLAALILHERLNLSQWLGVVLVISVLLASIQMKTRNSSVSANA